MLLSSCASTYFFSSLSSDNTFTEQVPNGDFIFENDSLWIAHSFNGEGAPILITVYNKLDQPLYVDWNRSALIIQDQAISYSGNQATINTNSSSQTSSYSTIWGNVNSYTEGQSQSQVVLPLNVDFVPPHTKVSKTTLTLVMNPDSFKGIEYSSAIMGNKFNVSSKVEVAKFIPETSPLKFTSYLTIYTNPEKSRSFEQDFYISSLIKTKSISPKNLPVEMQQRGDLFFVKKEADNTGWAILLGASLITTGVVIDAKTDYRYTNY